MIQHVVLYFFINAGSSKWKKNMTPKPRRPSGFLGMKLGAKSFPDLAKRGLFSMGVLSFPPKSVNGAIKKGINY